jgi:hypothetical protein
MTDALIGDGVMTDASGRMAFINSRAEHLTGYSAQWSACSRRCDHRNGHDDLFIARATELQR